MKITVKQIVDAVNGRLLSGSEDILVTSASVNSREIEEGALFVPIIGEKVDGHRFIEGAFENGAVASFVAESATLSEYVEGKAYIQVKDTLKALQALGSWYRDQFSMPVIGITGSVGKTTTKEMVGAALATKYNVIKTLGNMNSQIGLPLMMFHFEPKHEVAVIEMGMSEEGEMERLSAIAKPDMAIMTNIGVAHIGQLGSQENIRKEKLNLINVNPKQENLFKSGKKLFLNGDDKLLREIKENTDKIAIAEQTKTALEETECVLFGLEEDCAFYGKEICVKEGKTYFTLVYPEGEEEIILSVLGLHNVENALVALAVAYELGIKPSKAKEGLLSYQPIAMRGQVHNHNGMTIIDDTYNASPDSMKSSANILLQMENLDRRMIVLGDVLELGEVSYQCHYEVGTFIAKASYQGKTIDELLTVGQEAKAIAEGVRDCEEGKGIIVHSYDSNEEALAYLKEQAEEKTGIIVKGSRGMHMETIIQGLLEK